MLNTNPNLDIGDTLYGHKIIRRESMEAADGTPLVSVTVQLSAETCAYWFTGLPDGPPGWVPTMVGPHGHYKIQNEQNPNWWKMDSGSPWTCIHNKRQGQPTAYDELCDGECGEPDVPVVFPSEEEIADHVARAQRLLASVRP